MTHAALVIQNGYRSYKRHKKSLQNSLSGSDTHQQQPPSTAASDTSVSAASEQQQQLSSQCLQDFYTTFQTRHESGTATGAATTAKEASPSGPLK